MYKKRKICLCISSDLGIKVYNLINNKNNQIDIFSTKKFKNLKKASICKNKNIFYQELKKKNIVYDFIILVYWPYIVGKKVFNFFQDSINFHPSYLPYGRGWYPHIHSINRNFPWGVSLHKINSDVDGGDIWCRKKIKIKDFLTSDQLYEIGKKEIFNLFKRNFKKILCNKINAKKQARKTKFLKISDIEKYNEIKLNQKLKLKSFIKLLMSRQFKHKSFIYFKDGKKKNYLHLKIKKFIY